MVVAVVELVTQVRTWVTVAQEAAVQEVPMAQQQV
jgi:hypothetical protein